MACASAFAHSRGPLDDTVARPMRCSKAWVVVYEKRFAVGLVMNAAVSTLTGETRPR